MGKEFKRQGDFEMLSVSDKHWRWKIKVGATLPTNVFQEVCNILFEYMDIFAWDPYELGAIPYNIAEHHLGIPADVRKWQLIIRDNMQELLKAGIVKWVDYPRWLVNLVVVPKNNYERQMYIDNTDLNKAIPKKLFPLPRIDQVVDAVAGHAVLRS